MNIAQTLLSLTILIFQELNFAILKSSYIQRIKTLLIASMEMLPMWKRNSVTNKIAFHVFVILLKFDFVHCSVGFQLFLYLREKELC